MPYCEISTNATIGTKAEVTNYLSSFEVRL